MISLGNNCSGMQEMHPYIRLSFFTKPLQSECSDWLPVALSLHQDRPFIECPYKQKKRIVRVALHVGMYTAGVN